METPIAIVSINKDKYSETFIHNHVKLLPKKVYYLHGGYLPKFACLSDIGEDIATFYDEGNSEEIWKKNIADFLVEHKITAVLAEYGPSGVEMMEICYRLCIPLIVHFHGYDAYRNDIMNSYGPRYPNLFLKAASIIVVSKHMGKRLIELGAPKGKLFLNPCGSGYFERSLSSPKKNFTFFLAVGRFSETKSPLSTIQAFAKVQKIEPNVKLIMVGGGKLLGASKELAKKLGLQKNIEFKGVLPHDEVIALMKEASVFVQHSVTTSSNDTEGTPVSIVEASACSLPVVSTFHAGIPDVILHGKTGLLVKEGQIEKMAEYMLQLMQNRELAIKMGESGYERVLSAYSLERHIRYLNDIIDENIYNFRIVQGAIKVSSMSCVGL